MNRQNPVLLVIDDDPTFCRLMERLGEQEKFKVIAYSSARNAYRDLESVDYDVAIIDYDLGRVTGAQFSHYMERLKQNKPIVLISSSTIDGPVRWSNSVMAIESKNLGPYKVFFSALSAFDRFKGKQTAANSGSRD